MTKKYSLIKQKLFKINFIKIKNNCLKNKIMNIYLFFLNLNFE